MRHLPTRCGRPLILSSSLSPAAIVIVGQEPTITLASSNVEAAHSRHSAGACLVRQDSGDSEMLGLGMPDARASEVPVLNLECPSPVDFVSHKPSAHKPSAEGEVPQEELAHNLWKGLPPVKRGASLAEINLGEVKVEHDGAGAASAPPSVPTTPAPNANDVIDGWWL